MSVNGRVSEASDRFQGRQLTSSGSIDPRERASERAGRMPEKYEKRRDDDGTVDRSPDPTPELRKWLLLLKVKNEVDGIDLHERLRGGGGTNTGLFQTVHFLIALRTVYREWHWMPELLDGISTHYGCGRTVEDALGEAEALTGRNWGKEYVAYKDFCEDIDNADSGLMDAEIDAIVRRREDHIGKGFKYSGPQPEPPVR